MPRFVPHPELPSQTPEANTAGHILADFQLRRLSGGREIREPSFEVARVMGRFWGNLEHAWNLFDLRCRGGLSEHFLSARVGSDQKSSKLVRSLSIYRQFEDRPHECHGLFSECSILSPLGGAKRGSMPFPMLLGVLVLNGAKHSPRLGHYVDHRRPRWRLSKSGYSIGFIGVFIHALSCGAKPGSQYCCPHSG